MVPQKHHASPFGQSGVEVLQALDPKEWLQSRVGQAVE